MNIFMAASFLPSILVPLIGLVVPVIGIISFLRFVDKESIN